MQVLVTPETKKNRRESEFRGSTIIERVYEGTSFSSELLVSYFKYWFQIRFARSFRHDRSSKRYLAKIIFNEIPFKKIQDQDADSKEPYLSHFDFTLLIRYQCKGFSVT